MLCIDIESEFGAFNKSFSNTGGLLTYKVPPKTAIVGLLGAIVGYDLPKTIDAFKDVKIGVIPLGKIETKTITYTSHYGGRKGRLVNIKQELLVRPKYRIYIHVEYDIKNNEIMEHINTLLQSSGVSDKAENLNDGLELLLRNHISYFSLYMGKNDFPLRYQLRDIETQQLQPSDLKSPVTTECVVPRDGISKYKVFKINEKFGGLKIKRTEPFRVTIFNMPVLEKSNREFTDPKDFVLKEGDTDVTMEVLPKENSSYLLYKDDKGNLIICF